MAEQSKFDHKNATSLATVVSCFLEFLVAPPSQLNHMHTTDQARLECLQLSKNKFEVFHRSCWLKLLRIVRNQSRVPAPPTSKREGLANEPTSACPCGMQMTLSNVTFTTTKYAYSLCMQIASCIQQDQIVLKMSTDTRFCLACTGETWRSICHDDSLSVQGTHKFVQTTDTRSRNHYHVT